MNSERAAAVRDSIKGCPDIVDPEDTSEYSRKLEDRQHGGVEVTYTGEFLTPDSTFSPPKVEQVGVLGDGEGSERPVYAVVLSALWHEPSDVRSLSPQLVYEVAKHDCRIRFYPPDHRLGGDIWIVDTFSQSTGNTDGDRCPECGSTYFKIRDGQPECAKCGASEESAQTKLTEVQH
ncbi:hypothetical protein [Halobaculum sp. D14]|uniref:hypothetical protein n=1 Tax=Halobaculum sp. D14 TaxID=3421642 RepID=UPI003EBCB005